MLGDEYFLNQPMKMRNQIKHRFKENSFVGRPDVIMRLADVIMRPADVIYLPIKYRNLEQSPFNRYQCTKNKWSQLSRKKSNRDNKNFKKF